MEIVHSKGWHFTSSPILPRPFYGVTELEVEVLFDANSCDYSLPLPDAQDWNKVCGIDYTQLSMHCENKIRRRKPLLMPSGSNGDISYDSDFLYLKTASGWKRAALSTF